MTRLLLIGVPGVDWAGFAARSADGRLPRLAELRSRGSAASVTAFPSDAGPAAWASLATGRPPEAHGVFSIQEAWTGGLRPVSRASWREPPVWARLEAAGVSTGGVAWPASRAGADWDGIHVDDSFTVSSGPSRDQWALPLRCAPADARSELRQCRMHPTEVTTDMLGSLVPDLASVDQRRDWSLSSLATGMAEAATIQAAGVWMLHDRAPDAVFIHQPWLARVRSQFDAKLDGPYAHVVEGAWRFLDSLVGRLVEVAGDEATILVVSPGWRKTAGLLLSVGRPLASGKPAFDVLDIAPTALAVFGLQVSGTAPGGSATPFSASGASRQAAPTPSSPPAVTPDAELIATAAKAGFAAPAPPPPTWHADHLARLALLMLERAPDQARDLTAAALALVPKHLGALWLNATAQILLGEADDLLRLADELDRLAPDRGWGALTRGAYHVIRDEFILASPWLVKAEADPQIETLRNVATVWTAAKRPASADRVFRAVLARDPQNVPAQIGLAVGALARLDYMAAETALRRVIQQDPGRRSAYQQLAAICARTGRKAEAERIARIAASLEAAAEHSV